VEKTGIGWGTMQPKVLPRVSSEKKNVAKQSRNRIGEVGKRRCGPTLLGGIGPNPLLRETPATERKRELKIPQNERCAQEDTAWKEQLRNWSRGELFAKNKVSVDKRRAQDGAGSETGGTRK